MDNDNFSSGLLWFCVYSGPDCTVSFCDLRWGVDTSTLESDEGPQNVLDVCLDEIDRCCPAECGKAASIVHE